MRLFRVSKSVTKPNVQADDHIQAKPVSTQGHTDMLGGLGGSFPQRNSLTELCHSPVYLHSYHQPKLTQRTLSLAKDSFIVTEYHWYLPAAWNAGPR